MKKIFYILLLLLFTGCVATHNCCKKQKATCDKETKKCCKKQKAK